MIIVFRSVQQQNYSMTYCLGIKVKDGLVALSDTRISSGTNTTTRKKISIHQHDQSSFFLMTSGFRSVRDKSIQYLEDATSNGTVYDKLYKIVNVFGEIIRRVASEDRETLQRAGYKFNINTIIGGQLSADAEHKLFLIYSEGNWIEIGQGSPYVVIGNTSHGKGILNQIITDDATIEQAMKAAFISFEATRKVSNDVEFPIDVMVYKKNSFSMKEAHFLSADLQHVSESWHKKLKQSVEEIPNDWIENMMNQQSPIK